MSAGTVLRWTVRGLLAAGAVALAACTSEPLVRHYVVPSGACCSTVAQHTFTPLPLGQETDVSLTPASPTLTLNGQHGHFVGFGVPVGVVATALSMKTYLSTSFLPKATAVAPEVHFFDAQFRPLGTVAVNDMQVESGFWRGGLAGRVAVPRDTRYIVLRAGSGEGSYAVVRSENGTPYRVPPAALGDMSVRLFGERVAAQ